MAERQILRDPISVGWIHEPCCSQCPPTFGLFILQQMAFAGAPAHDFPGAGDLETFGHRLSGFISFWTSHSAWLSLARVLECGGFQPAGLGGILPPEPRGKDAPSTGRQDVCPTFQTGA